MRCRCLTAPARSLPFGPDHLGRQLRLRAAHQASSRSDRHACLRPRRVQAGHLALGAVRTLASPPNCAAGSSIWSSTCKGLLRTGLMCLATGAPRRIGFANAREGSRYTLHAADSRTGCRADPRGRSLLARGRGARRGRRAKALPRSARSAEVKAARDALAGLPRPWIAVAVGAKWVTKRWPTGALRGAVESSVGAHGGNVLLRRNRR